MTSEAVLQQAVIDLAGYLGYLVHHDRPAQYRDGSWATHISGDPGFPDLVLCSTPSASEPGRILFIELKSKKGRTTIDQENWLEALRACPGVETYLFRPTDWSNGTIERVLKKAPVPDEETEGWIAQGWPV